MAALGLTSTTDSVIKSRYYDELFLKVAESNLVHKQLGQIDRQIGPGQGGYGTGVLYWARFVTPTTVTSGSGEGTATSAVTISAVTVTGTTIELDNAITYSDLLAYTSYGGSLAAPGFMKPEGVVIYHTAANIMFKKTFKNDEKGKGE